MTARITALSALALALSLALPVGASAQDPEPQLVDRVVAVVGDSVILASDIQEQVERRRAFGQAVPEGEEGLEALRRQELEALINELVMVQAAERDSIAVPQEQIESQVEAALTQQEQRFGSRAAFQRALESEGMTLEQYERMVRRNVRRAGIRQQFEGSIQRDRSPPPVSDEEIRTFFEARREELGSRPATIEFEQVVVAPEPSDAAMAEARAEAERALDALREGEDFATVARRFSDDPGTRERGGELGWFRRGRMVPDFERAAFALRPGQTSGIVESSFGFHIIKVDRVRGPERLARHILIRPEVTAEDRQRAPERAEEVARALRAGAAIDSLVERYHDESERPRVGPLAKDDLPSPYDAQLRNVSAGDIVGPFRVQVPTGEGHAVVKVRAVAEAGEYTADDPELRAQIRQFLQREKLLQEVLSELRGSMYVDVRY